MHLNFTFIMYYSTPTQYTPQRETNTTEDSRYVIRIKYDNLTKSYKLHQYNIMCLIITHYFTGRNY
jgi:hypothetical protein